MGESHDSLEMQLRQRSILQFRRQREEPRNAKGTDGLRICITLLPGSALFVFYFFYSAGTRGNFIGLSFKGKRLVRPAGKAKRLVNDQGHPQR